MYDSIKAASIPAGVTFAAGYDTGFEQGWPPEQWARFNPAVHICTRDGVDTGDVFDMESGAASISGAPAWLNLRRAATGVWKSLYYSVGLDAQVQQVLADAGIPSAEVPKWVAWYDGDDDLASVNYVVGVVAKQYANSAITGANYDLSVVADFWPGIDTKPQQEVGDVKFFQVQIQGSDDWIASVDGNGVLHVGFLPDNDPTGTAWGDNVVTLPGGGVAGGNKPNSPCEVWVDTAHGKLNVWTYGANGDRFHWQYDIASNAWSGLSA